MWVPDRGYLPGELVVVSGPSGCGKSTILRRVVDQLPDRVQLSISATTRPPRPAESDGIDYFFMAHDMFLLKKDNGEFLEHAEYGGQRYGTPAAPVFDRLAAGKTVLLEIEVRGAKQVRDLAPSALFVFIKAPSFRALELRLRNRRTETDAEIYRRLQTGRQELSEAHWYDHQLINDDLDRCTGELIAILNSHASGG